MHDIPRLVIKADDVPLLRQELLRACGLAVILNGWNAWNKREYILKYWRTDLPVPNPKVLRQHVRRQEVMDYIKGGHIEPTEYHDALSPYTPEFFLGLQLSGAIYETCNDHGQLCRFILNHPILIQDIEKMPFQKRLTKNQSCDYRLSTSIFLLPTESYRLLAIFAGVIAGAKEKDGWLLVPKTEKMLHLLDRLPIAILPGHSDGYLRISPFYEALMANAGYLPSTLNEHARSRKEVAGVPLIPAMVWEVTFGGIVPKAGILPYLCGSATLKRKRWGKDYLHGKAIESGCASTGSELRGLLERYIGGMVS